MKKIFFFIAFLFVTISCTSTKSTIKNIDNTAPDLILKDNDTFLITIFSKDKKYGYDMDYPINLYCSYAKNENTSEKRFLNALSGPNGEKISYTKLESCCPFPTERSKMGAGLLNVYELKWEGQQKPVTLYLNIYEKGILMVPVGLSLNK